MSDAAITVVIGVLAALLLVGQFRRTRKGGNNPGCAGCGGCSSSGTGKWCS